MVNLAILLKGGGLILANGIGLNAQLTKQKGDRTGYRILSHNNTGTADYT